GGSVDFTASLHSLTFTGTKRTVTFGSNATVPSGASLTLGSNVIVSAPSVLTVSGSLIGSASGYVIGTLKKTFGAIGTKTFEVGTANGY
ncbi:hypothetical protein NL529_29635, partial [Klebsiella pneumoniae]|nr:hypothetical protein [Klebsiella pneumoniae]